jgi:hypothetical protein
LFIPVPILRIGTGIGPPQGLALEDGASAPPQVFLTTTLGKYSLRTVRIVCPLRFSICSVLFVPSSSSKSVSSKMETMKTAWAWDLFYIGTSRRRREEHLEDASAPPKVFLPTSRGILSKLHARHANFDSIGRVTYGSSGSRVSGSKYYELNVELNATILAR